MRRSGLRASLLLVLCLFVIGLAAEGRDYLGMTWRGIDGERGFHGGRVSGILQDRRGLIWIAAAGGLFRYDGLGFERYLPWEPQQGTASSSVSAIAADADGRLWIGTDGAGLFRFFPEESRFEAVRPEVLSISVTGPASAADYRPASGAVRAADAIPSAKASAWSRITALALDGQGRLWVGTAAGSLFRGDAGNRRFIQSVEPERSEKPITSILADSRSRILVGRAGGGLSVYSLEGSPVTSFLHDASRPSGIASDKVTAILEDSLGFVWIGLGHGGVDLFEDGSFRHARAVLPLNSASPGVTALAEDPKGRIWAGFSGGGISILDPSSMEMEIEDFADGEAVTALFRDRRGLMWLGLERNGLLTGDLRSAGFERFTKTREGDPLGEVLALAQTPHGDVFIATGQGRLAVLGAGKDAFSALYPRLPDFDPSEVRVMLGSRDGSLWLGGAFSGIARLSPEGYWSWFRVLPELECGVLSLQEEGSGHLLVGTVDGVLGRLDPRNGAWSSILSAPGGGNEGRRVASLLPEPGGGIWAGSTDSGLSYFDPRTEAWTSLLVEGQGPGDLRIESLRLDSRGSLLVGTGGAGLSAVDPDSGIVLYRGEDLDMAAEAIFAIVEDRSGLLWVASSLGLYCVDQERTSSYLYGAEDGLCPGSLRTGALLVDSEGRIVLGSGGGVTRFDPARAPRYSPVPEVVIVDISMAAFGASPPRPGRVPLGAAGDRGLVLAYDNPGLRFGIAVIDYLAPQRNRYAMQLEGRHGSWVRLGAVNAGYIAPLPPGDYMLRVKAANGNGTWNDYGASLRVFVEPPWWARWWFRGLAVGMAGMAAVAAVFFRIGVLRRRNALLVNFARHVEEAREEERRTAARDIHDEIGQHLMVLNLHAYWLASHVEAAADERGTKLAEMQEAIQNAMGAVKAVANRLRPTVLETQDFSDAVRLYARSFKRVSGIDAVLRIEEGWREPPALVASTALRILQELLSNVSRHSGAAAVELRLGNDGDVFLFQVTDDGRGLPPERLSAPDSFGIIGMRERCAGLGGSIDFAEAPGGGCSVRVRLPAKEERSGRNA